MKRFNITVNGKAYDVAVQEIAAGTTPAAAAPVMAPAPAPAPTAAPAPAVSAATAPASAAGSVKIEAPMPGNIIDVKVSAGQTVEEGQALLILEAMKMENDIVSPVAGTITGVHVNKGDSVDTGALLISIS